MKIEDAISAALRNIARYGDTDIFPFPIEKHVFHDRPNECASILMEMHSTFDSFLSSYPPITIETLTQVGYTGFRWATQIEPFWNAYYLALVISLADKIEAERIPEEEKVVFSYRFHWNDEESKLFKNIGWNDFKMRSLELSDQYDFVVVTDIADFYPRVYHHRIENGLQRLSSANDIPKRIVKLLMSFSKNVSYGLPIGGPASRILAELSLNAVDKLLHRQKIVFCRSADDYCMFCNDKSEAYKSLVFLSEKVYNEGLVLQKKKTRILTADEYREISGMIGKKQRTSTNEKVSDEQKLLNISIRFDPYSETAVEDYEKLKAAVNEVDIIGILGRELTKTAIDSTITKQAINAIRALEPRAREGALMTILNAENLVVLSPVFVTIMLVLKSIYDELSEDGKSFVDKILIELYAMNSHLLSVELNLSYYVQVLSKRRAARKEEILIEIFNNHSSALIRRQIILVMANWNCHYWLSDLKREYSGLNGWEKRAFIIASYFLGDEGEHWRRHHKKTWSKIDLLVKGWFESRFNQQTDIPI